MNKGGRNQGYLTVPMALTRADQNVLRVICDSHLGGRVPGAFLLRDDCKNCWRAWKVGKHLAVLRANLESAQSNVRALVEASKATKEETGG